MEYSRHAPVPQNVRWGVMVLGCNAEYVFESWGFSSCPRLFHRNSRASPHSLQVQLELVSAYQKRRASGEKK
jgi:hypothetical protein